MMRLTEPIGPPADLIPEDAPLYCCHGAACMDVSMCTCWVPIYDRAQAEPHQGNVSAQLSPCGDCAYRKGSPEMSQPHKRDELVELVDTGKTFWCHQGMRKLIGWRHPEAGLLVMLDEDHYAPEYVDPKTPAQADGSPALICGGWLRAREALWKRLVLEENDVDQRG